LNKKVNFSLEEHFEEHEIFKQIQILGNISTYEMYQTFNMGLGFCIVANRKEEDKILAELKSVVEAKVIGRVYKGKRLSIPSLSIHYSLSEHSCQIR